MGWYRVWLHGGEFAVKGQDIEAETAREAAEKAHGGGPLDAHGPLHQLRATVIATDQPTNKSDSFFNLKPRA